MRQVAPASDLYLSVQTNHPNLSTKPIDEDHLPKQVCGSRAPREDSSFDHLCIWSTGLWEKACKLKGFTLQKNANACKSL